MCHGPAALVSATDAEGGSIFKGKRVTCFTDKEEELAQKMEVRLRSLHMSPISRRLIGARISQAIPFLTESRLRELGATFENAGPWEVSARPFPLRTV